MASERLRSMTAGRAATGTLALRPEEESLYLGALAVDLTGDGVDELLCLYEDLKAERRLQLDGWRLSRP